MNTIEFELPHITLSGLTNDNVGKPPVLMLHGWLDNAGSFENMMPFLHGYHVIAVDLPGHGLSQKRSVDANYHFVDWAYDIYQLVQYLKWPPFTLVGHSMGGMIGSMFAGTMPEKVDKLFLIDTIGFVTTPANQTVNQLRKSVMTRESFSRRSKSAHPSLHSAIEARVSAGGVDASEARILAQRGVEKVSEGYRWRSDSRLRGHSAMRMTFEQAVSFIKNIECPVTMVAGESGSKMVRDATELYQPYFGNIKCLTMPGGHHCHMTHPQTAAQLLLDFID